MGAYAAAARTRASGTKTSSVAVIANANASKSPRASLCGRTRDIRDIRIATAAPVNPRTATSGAPVCGRSPTHHDDAGPEEGPTPNVKPAGCDIHQIPRHPNTADQIAAPRADHAGHEGATSVGPPRAVRLHADRENDVELS